MGLKKWFGLDRETIRASMQRDLQLEADIEVRKVLDSLHEGFIVINEQSVVLTWNEEAERIFGYSRTEAEGSFLDKLIIPESQREFHRKGIETFLRTGRGLLLNTKIEVNGLRNDGSEVPIELTISPVSRGDDWIFYAFVHDITERRRAQVLYEELSSIVNYSQDAIYSVDANLRVVSWNRAAENMFGYTHEEMVGETLDILIPRDHEDEVGQILSRTVQGLTVGPFSTKRIRKNFVTLDINLLVSPVKSHTGNIIGASVIARDITEELKNERIREIYESILMTAPYAIAAYDREGRIMAFNPAAEKLYGVSASELEGKNIDDFISEPKLKDEIHLIFQKVINTGEPVENYYTKRKNALGEEFTAFGTYTALRNRNDIIIGVYAVIITDEEWDAAVTRSGLNAIDLRKQLLDKDRQDRLLGKPKRPKRRSKKKPE